MKQIVGKWKCSWTKSTLLFPHVCHSSWQCSTWNQCQSSLSICLLTDIWATSKLPVTNCAAINTGVHVPLQYGVSISSRKIPRRGPVGSSGVSALWEEVPHIPSDPRTSRSLSLRSSTTRGTKSATTGILQATSKSQHSALLLLTPAYEGAGMLGTYPKARSTRVKLIFDVWITYCPTYA